MVRVTFVVPEQIHGRQVYLVGDFNGWERGSHPIHRGSNGQRSTVLDLRPARAYQFRYWCDGQWYNDDASDAMAANRYGGQNSVVITAIEP